MEAVAAVGLGNKARCILAEMPLKNARAERRLKETEGGGQSRTYPKPGGPPQAKAKPGEGCQSGAEANNKAAKICSGNSIRKV
jgi:hypothetical protein